MCLFILNSFFFSSRRRHTRWNCDWSSDVCSSDLGDRSRPRHAQGPGEPRHLQHLHHPSGVLDARAAGGRRAQVPYGGVGLPRLQAAARGQYHSGAGADARAARAPPRRPRARARDPARRRGARPRHRPEDHPRSAHAHGPARRRGGMMRDFMQRMVEVLQLEFLAQLGLAVLLGGAIGFERELGGKPAGLRTNILICVGSVLYTKLSMTMAGTNADPTRVAAQIVTGVGFIGAGTILHARGAVVGLTSAATIWVVAAIGVGLGAGHYYEALAATLVVILVLQGLGRVEGFVSRQSTHSHLVIHARPEPAALEDLEALVRRTGLEVERVESRKENVDLVIEYDIRGPKRLHDQVMIAILHHPVVRTVSTGE